MKKLLPILSVVSMVSILACASSQPSPMIQEERSSQVLTHPDSLNFDSLNWQIPNGELYRSELNGMPFYYAQEQLPLFSMRLIFEAGPLFGEGRNGVSTLYPYMLKNGGTTEFTPEELDSILTLNAISISASSSDTQTAIAISGLEEKFPLAMELLGQLFNEPRFDSTKMVQYKTNIESQIAHRFDEPAPIMKIAGMKIFYPGGEPARLVTSDQINAVDSLAIAGFHNHIMTEAPLSIAFAGTITKVDVENAITSLFPTERTVIEPVIDEPLLTPTHDVIIIQKPINQAYILIGQPLFQRPDERYYPLTIFNAILGGGGFNSRLMSEVRSNAGLTYSINSSLNTGYYYDGAFTVSLFTKSESVNHGIGLTLATIDATLAEDITDEEIEEKKIEYISSLPSSFRSGSDIVSTYQNNEVMGRDMDHYIRYPERLMALSTEDVLTIARETIDPDKFVMVIVGDTTELFNAPEWNGFKLEDLNPLIMTTEELLHFNDERQESE